MCLLGDFWALEVFISQGRDHVALKVVFEQPQNYQVKLRHWTLVKSETFEVSLLLALNGFELFIGTIWQRTGKENPTLKYLLVFNCL